MDQKLAHAAGEMLKVKYIPTKMTRFKQFISEVTLLSKSEFDPKGSDFKIRHVELEARENKKPLPGYDEYTYTITEKDNRVFIYIFDNKNPDMFIGYLQIESLYSYSLPKGAVMVSPLMVHPNYRRQGIAKTMYKMFLEKPPKGLGKILVSDSSQTRGGQMAWASLASIPGIEITGLIKLQKPRPQGPGAGFRVTSAEMEKDLMDTYDDLFGKVGGVYLEENDYYYFYQIPVSAIGKKLENGIKSSKIKIYKSSGEGTSYESFLMAKL